MICITQIDVCWKLIGAVLRHCEHIHMGGSIISSADLRAVKQPGAARILTTYNGPMYAGLVCIGAPRLAAQDGLC